MAERAFVPKHNMVVSLDLQANGVGPYTEIVGFLMRSRVFHVLTHSPTLYIQYIRQFWSTARYDCTQTPPVIRATVNERAIQFSAGTLRNILLLGTEDEENGPTEFPVAFRVGAFQRMGYVGDFDKSAFIKSNVFGQWRYLMHVMIVSLAAKKAGFDAMTPNLQSGMLSLVYNKPFSFSQFFFDNMTSQINAVGKERFLLYPRFMMMIINHLIPDLPPHQSIVQVSVVDRRIYADCQGHSSKKPIDQRPVNTPLFGYLLDEHYVAPPNDGWLDVVQPEQEGEQHVQPAAAEAVDAAAQVPPQQPQQPAPEQQPQPQPEQAPPEMFDAQPEIGAEQPEAENIDEQQAVLDDVMLHVEQPQGGEPVDAAVVQEVVQAILAPGGNQAMERDEVDEYDDFVAAGGVLPEFDEPAQPSSGPADKGKDIGDDDIDDNDSEPDFPELK